ncbi:hypothetical protein ACHAWF_018501 [Thalassiosira exigua]
MISNCSAQMSLINRSAKLLWAQRQRPRSPLARQKSTNIRPFRLPDSALPTAPIYHAIASVSTGCTFERPHLLPAHDAVGQSRTMVMVTQTRSSEDEGPTNSAGTSEISPDDATEVITSEGVITITASCAARIRQLASTRPNPHAVYLRLYVDAGGCSGFQYKFLLLSEENDGCDVDEDDDVEDGAIDPEEDIIFERDGMRVVVDQTSLDLLKGSTIDYVQEMIRSSFAVVSNPQSESACGCGSSFAVKNFESNPALD